MVDPKMIHLNEEKANTLHVTVYPSDSAFVEEFLTQMHSYIMNVVTKGMRGNSFRAHPALLDLEIDEVIQSVRIKFWQAWQKRHIEKPIAYLRRIVHNEIVEFARTYEPSIPLPLDDHGELQQGQMILAPDKNLRDPLEIQFPEAWERITKKNILTMVKVILYLPEQQRYALLYKLNSVIDDIFYLKTALQDLGVDLQQITWPQTPQEKQRMRASYFAAKRTLASILGPDKEDRMKNAIEWVTWQERRRSLAAIALTAKEKPTREITQLLYHLEDLKDPYQTVLRLHYLEQRSYSDIATLLNLSIGTVKAQVQRGLEGLHQFAEGKATKRYAKRTEEEQHEHMKILSEIKARVSDLKEPYQTAVYLRYVEGKGCPEIATQLNLPLSTITSRVRRGLQMLNIQLPS